MTNQDGLRYRRGPARPAGEPRPLGLALQHLLLAGPVLGLVATLYTYDLSCASPSHPEIASSHVIEQVRLWHGQFLGRYYITPREHWIEECLAFPVGCWMILVIAGLVYTGFRFEAEKRHGCRAGSDRTLGD